MHSSEHIRNRIEWCARKHGLPEAYTGFWPDAPEILQWAASDHVQDPVVYSVAPSGRATIIGTDAIIGIGPNGITAIPLKNLVGVIGSNLFGSGKTPKSELSELAITDSSERTHHVFTEKGSPCFAIWNILLMLSRLRKN